MGRHEQPAAPRGSARRRAKVQRELAGDAAYLGLSAAPVEGCDLHVCFGAVEALRGVSVRVQPGEFLAVTGPSGAGKTTLLWVLAGAVPARSGVARIGEHEIRTRDQSARLGVALIPQGNGLAAVLTAVENTVVPLLAAGRSPEQARTAAVAALAAVGLADSVDHLVEELSGGQQQRVAVARGLALASPILLADEPTSELDHDNRDVVLALLRARADAGAVVVMATHDPDAAAVADRVIRLDDGKLVEDNGAASRGREP